MILSRLPYRRLLLALIIAAFIACCGSAYAAREQRFILLGMRKVTSYVVVVSANATPGEAFAAKELAKLLSDTVGGDFVVVPDTTPPVPAEIAVGATNRKSLGDVPPELKPVTREGFTILREGEKVFILGNTPRATLYGVYDFLEQELGVQFYAPDYTYMPFKEPYQVIVKSRVYDPPLQYRNINVTDPLYALRLRVNTSDRLQQYEPIFGGFKWIGPASEFTCDHLVPVKQYFEPHPEYFSMIDGKRVSSLNGHPTQLCLSNPDVLKIAIARVREWIEYAKRTTGPLTSMVVSVSPNDSGNFCACEQCAAINKEEGVAQGGTLIRFANAVSDAITLESPGVSVETTVTNGIDVPKVTKPVSSLIIRLKSNLDYRFPVDNIKEKKNRPLYDRLAEWSKVSPRVYLWNRMVDTGDYMKLTPNLTLVDSNTLAIAKAGAKGMYAQTQQSRGTDLCDLRNYLLAQSLWRPEGTNTKQITKDYLASYYGNASADIRRFLDYIAQQGIDPAFSATDPLFLDKCNTFLARAEINAGNDDVRDRVAALRVPIWYQMIRRDFAEVGRVAAIPNEWHFTPDPKNIGIDLGYITKTSFDDWQKITVDKSLLEQGIDFQGVSWYATSFESPSYDSKKLAVYFAAADGEVDVYLDGKQIGQYKVEYHLRKGIPFFMPLPGAVTAGKHTLVVQLYNPRSTNGITGPVSLVDLAAPIPDALKADADRYAAAARRAKVTALNDYGVDNPAQLDIFFNPTFKYWLSRGKEIPPAQVPIEKPK